MDRRIGLTGTLLLLALFVLLFAEDLYIWVVAGTVPGVEFLVGAVVVLVVAYLAVRAAREHPPPRR